jgi:hypothetical protein
MQTSTGHECSDSRAAKTNACCPAPNSRMDPTRQAYFVRLLCGSSERSVVGEAFSMNLVKA